nr:hypothetical protein [Candidatus Gracilibacteria bacterium]
MSENIEINSNNTQFDKNEKIEDLLNQSNIILNAFKSDFGETSDLYKNALVEYNNIKEKINVLKKEITSKTNEQIIELKDDISDNNIKNVENEFTKFQTMFIEMIKLKPETINSISIQSIQEDKLNALFNYYIHSTGNELTFITNNEFIEKFLRYSFNNNIFVDIDYSNLYNKLNPVMKQRLEINKYFIAYSKNISYISNKFINDAVNLKNLIENNIYFNVAFNNGLFNKELFYKQLFLKIDNPSALDFLIDYCIKDEGTKIYTYFPVNKDISLINSKIKANAEIDINTAINRTVLLNTKSDNFKLLSNIILDSNSIKDISEQDAIGLIELINIHSEIKAKTAKDVIEILNSKNITDTLINTLNDYILNNGINNNGDISTSLLKLIQNGYYSQLYTIHNDINFTKEILKTSSFNGIEKIINLIPPEMFNDESLLKTIIDSPYFNLKYLSSFKINDLKHLDFIYSKLIGKNFTANEIFLNPNFSEYTETYLKLNDKNGVNTYELEKGFFGNKEFIGSYLSHINTIALQFNKEEILKIIINNGIQKENVEKFYQKFLEATLSLDNAKSAYPELLEIAGGKGSGEKIKKIWLAILNEQQFYLSDRDGKIKYDINSLLQGINIDDISKTKPKIKDFFIGKELDLNFVLSEFKKFVKNNPKPKGENENKYQWEIRNKFIEYLGFKSKQLTNDEARIKDILLNITKIEFLDKKIEQDIATKDSYFKFLKGEIKESDYLKEVDEYQKKKELEEEGIKSQNQNNHEIINSQNTETSKVSGNNGEYSFTTTSNTGEIINLPITNYEATLIKGSEKTKENFKNFTETLSELNLLNLWKYREGIFKAIAEKRGISFNANDDFLKEEEIKLFLGSIIKSINNDSKISFINKNFAELKNDIKKINVIGQGKDTQTGYSPIEKSFIEKFTDKNNKGQFLQDKFKQYI